VGNARISRELSKAKRHHYQLFLVLKPMLYDFHTRFFGLNQIRSTFFPNLEKEGNYALDWYNMV